MKNITYVIVLIFILLLFGCISKTKDVSIEMELKNMIVNSKNDTINFKLGDFIDSNYDKFLILLPYTRIDWVEILEKDLEINSEKNSKINLKKVVKKTGIEQRDDICVLCMFENNTLKEYQMLNRRNSIDWSGIKDSKFIDRDTELRIVKNRYGEYNVEKISSPCSP